MAEADLVQLNVGVEPDIVAAAETLAEENGWSKRHTITLAIRALANLMDQHKFTAEHTDEDRGELFLALSREMPAGLVDLKDSVKFARLKTKRPAVLVDGWTITAADDGELVGLQPVDGGFRMATITDGAIRVKATWSAEEAEAALAAEAALN
jgi:hypothetical protein